MKKYTIFVIYTKKQTAKTRGDIYNHNYDHKSEFKIPSIGYRSGTISRSRLA